MAIRNGVRSKCLSKLGVPPLLLSMTGHGQASNRERDISIDVEIRTVNNRYLKVSNKVSELGSAVEPQIENIVREHLRRGSVNVSVRVVASNRRNAASINQTALENYLRQSIDCANRLGIAPAFEFGQLLQLPGVLEIPALEEDEALSDRIRETIKQALLDLHKMRAKEGIAMAAQFASILDQMEECKSKIEVRAPLTAVEYRNKLEQRVRSALNGLGIETSEIDLLREVLLYADRCDVSEELTRLGSHVSQFREALHSDESQGRRMDFLIQELMREVNTIGSKANDSQISQQVVSMKTLIEQMRELIQNVE